MRSARRTTTTARRSTSRWRWARGRGSTATRRRRNSGRSTGAEYYRKWDSGYSKQQATRPQTLGYGLADSPAGQAAWILEKFWAWTDCDGHPENVLTRDELLDNVMMYWATNSATSSARIYWESFGRARATQVRVPVGVTVYPKEIVTPVRSRGWKRTTPTSVTGPSSRKGGHFAAFEQPELFVDDVRTCFRQFR